MTDEILRAEYLGMHTSAQAVLRSVSFRVPAGQLAAVVANLHETRCLAAILSGRDRPDAGRLLLCDRPVSTAADLRQRGLYFLSSHSQMIPTMSIARNLYLIRGTRTPGTLIHDAREMARAGALLREYGLTGLSPHDMVGDLDGFQMLLLELACLASLGARILVLDDVLCAASAANRNALRGMLGLLRQKNIAVLCLSSKYDPLFEDFDELAIVRSGVTVKVLPRGETGRASCMRHLSSYDLPQHDAALPPAGGALLEAHGLALPVSARPLDFTVHCGEAVGLWDVDWKYGAALGEALFGRAPFTGGLALEGRHYRPTGPEDAMRRGVALSSSANRPDPIYREMSLYDNVTLVADPIVCNRLGFASERIKKHITQHALSLIGAEQLIGQYGSRRDLTGISSLDQLRIVIAKWLCIHPKLLVLVNPFTLLDDLTIRDFREIVRALRLIGVAVLIVSMNGQSLRMVCDRVLPLE